MTASRRRRPGLAALIASAGLVVGSPALAPTVLPTTVGIADAAPDSGRSAAPAPARIALDGTSNARTFSNYTTADGRAVSGAVIRSADLQNLTARGVRTLRQRDVATIIDLRTDVERMLKPNRAVPGATTVVADVMALAPLAGSADFPGMYRTFVDNPGARRAYGTMLASVLRTVESGHGVLIHCSAGRDRTGWASAVILRAVGVDMSVIEADFTAGRTGVDVRWLRGAFAHARTLYGSFDRYLTEGLGFSADQRQRLRTALTAQDGPVTRG
ncbi:tyrosine-protein phosphatase [Gordonia shandongensis]|uniref:tyrosine-protein phosphatase n=1 Tax=Gordonia shandongensis TaxID=376351 RepID=UPI000405D1EF|nr:tyrosine-protein phosphatase [Gordonia shandongensis]